MAEAFAQWATGIGIILGVIGGAWKWFIEDAIRRRVSRPALSGRMEVEMASGPGAMVLVSVRWIWHNDSAYSVYVDPMSVITVYELPPEGDPGAVNRATLDAVPSYAANPFEDCETVALDPGTDTVFTAIFQLPKGKLFAAEAELSMDVALMQAEDSWQQRGIFATPPA